MIHVNIINELWDLVTHYKRSSLYFSTSCHHYVVQ